MKKIDKILDMFDELLKTDVPSDEAVFIVANSFYTSRDERINKDTLFRYIKTQVNIERFHKALEKRDLSIVNPERYSKKKIFSRDPDNNGKIIVSGIKPNEKKTTLQQIQPKEISPADLVNEMNSLKEIFDAFTKNYSKEKKVLDIPKEMFTISEKNIKRITFRVEKNILSDLEDFCEEHREFNKTLIINFMIKEFLKNYKK